MKKLLKIIVFLSISFNFFAHNLLEKKLSEKEIYSVLFNLYFTDSVQLSTTEKRRRQEIHDGLWEYIKDNQEIMSLLGMLQPTSLFFPEDIKIQFIDILEQGILNTPEIRLQELQYAFRRHARNDVRMIASLIRKLFSHLIYSNPLTAKIAGYEISETQLKNIKKQNKPFKVPDSKLKYEHSIISHIDGMIDYIIVGSGPAASVIAHDLTKEGFRVVIIEAGPFVQPHSISTESSSEFMESNNQRTNSSGGIIIRNGKGVGGGTLVNIDLAFSPLLPQIKSKIQSWIDNKIIPAELIHEQHNDWKHIQHAYDYIVEKIGTRNVESSEINSNNKILLDAYPTAQTYDLNEHKANDMHDILKISSVDAFILPALLNKNNQYKGDLSIIPSAQVQRILFDKDTNRAIGVQLTFEEENNAPYLLSDINNFETKTGSQATIFSNNIILAAGTLGSSAILLQTPEIKNERIGKGIIIHPSMGIYGRFDKEINIKNGLSASVYAPALNPEDQYFFESMSADPSFLALINLGSGKQLIDIIRDAKFLGGFGIMLIDSVNSGNKVSINPQTNKVEINYMLKETDKIRLRKALKEGIKLLFSQGAYEVYVPTSEPILSSTSEYKPFTSIDQVDAAIDKLQFIENQNFITCAHMQGSNKMGNNPKTAVVSPNFKLWNVEQNKEYENIYVCDASIFPTSVGANPMQTIYTFGKLCVDKIIREQYL